MNVSPWTSSYNAQYRGDESIIAPNAGETMHHFRNHYDKSHFQLNAGFYGTRAALAATAREHVGDSIRQATRDESRGGGGFVGYGHQPHQSATSSNDGSMTSMPSGMRSSLYAPPTETGAKNYSALKQNGWNMLQTQRIDTGTRAEQEMSRSGPPSVSMGGDQYTARGSPSRPYSSSSSSYTSRHGGSNPITGASQAPDNAYGAKDLWNHPTVAHGPDRSGYAPTRGQTLGQPFANTPAAAYAADGQQGSMTSTFSNARGDYGANAHSQQQPFDDDERQRRINGSSGSIGYTDRSFADAPNDWRYDDRGVAMAKEVELRRNTDPRAKFHIPGYAGFVRGKDNVYGETFAKVTRTCLDIPKDYPTDIPT